MVRVLVPSGALGLGWESAALEKGIANAPDLIAIDGGSTDSGPHYLGTGTSKYARASTKLEWGTLIEAARRAGCPLVIGTAGTCGAGTAVDWLLEITRECLAEQGARAKIAVLKSDQDAATVLKAMGNGGIRPLSPAPAMDADLVESCSNIVALAGAEQINAALETGADIIIAGRTTDTAIIAALPLARGCHAGAAWHGAKIGECGALCATNPQSGVLQLDFDDTGCVVTPLAETSNASPHTVSAHMLYENSDPFRLYEPGGYLDVNNATYEQLDHGGVRIEGAEWVTEAYCVKLEGARVSGYQTILISLLRDPRYVSKADDWARDINELATKKAALRTGVCEDEFQIELRLIGKNATLGDLETQTGVPIEIGAMGIVTAKTQALANEIGRILNPYLLHHPLTKEEEQPTFAFPFSPAEIDRGPVYEFCLNHVMALDDPMDAFGLEVIDA